MWEAEKGGLFEPQFRRLRPTQLDLGNTTRCCLNIETIKKTTKGKPSMAVQTCNLFPWEVQTAIL